MIEPILTPELRQVAVPRAADFEWHEWDVQQYFYYLPEPFPMTVQDLTPRAAWALTLAISEWLEAYLFTLDKDETLNEYILAGWAGSVDRRYCEHYITDDEEWRGPVRGPMNVTLSIIAEMYFLNEDVRASSAFALFAENLARHVLPDQQSFEAWLGSIFVRLNACHSYGAENPGPEPLFSDDFYLGKIVGRSLFDTSRPYDPAQAEVEMRSFIARIDPSNPFLEVA